MTARDASDAGAGETVTVTVVDGDDETAIEAARGETLRDVLRDAGFSPYTRYTERLNCGGRGICATCGVRIETGTVDPAHWHDALADRFGYPRLSCQIRLDRDLTVRIPDKRVWGGREPDGDRPPTATTTPGTADGRPKRSRHEPAAVSERYRTVAERGEAAFEVQGSEFVGHAAPVASVAEAEAFVKDVSAAYDDATHNVPAYRVRADPLREWSSDAGEPSGSAGKPALNVLTQEALENVAVVVTRYYGGTKLGVGGLSRAYGRAVKRAVDDAGIVERRPHESFTVTVDYDDSGTVRGLLESTGVEFAATYEADVSFAVRVPVDDAPELRDRIRSATSGRAEIATD